MPELREPLQGYKTYISAAIIVLTAILGFINGEQDIIMTVYAIAGALGLGFLRRGVKTSAPTPPAE